MGDNHDAASGCVPPVGTNDGVPRRGPEVGAREGHKLSTPLPKQCGHVGGGDGGGVVPGTPTIEPQTTIMAPDHQGAQPSRHKQQQQQPQGKVERRGPNSNSGRNSSGSSSGTSNSWLQAADNTSNHPDAQPPPPSQPSNLSPCHATPIPTHLPSPSPSPTLLHSLLTPNIHQPRAVPRGK